MPVYSFFGLNWSNPSHWRPLQSAALPHSADPQPATIDQADVYLVWLGDTPLALSRRTPSVQVDGGCRIQWDQAEQLFVDPCGGSRFLRDGRYKYGPAPRSLDRLPVRIVNHTIEIDPMHTELGEQHP